MLILVLNSGSSSLKYRLIQTSEETNGETSGETNGGEVLAGGLIERIGGPEVPTHRAALELALQNVPTARVQGVGHRIVHGGERFRTATLLTDEAILALAQLTPLAPLHNPPALEGIAAARELLPGVPNVGVFDTAFHTTLPPRAFLYAIARELYEKDGVRRYGFHGTSHAYVARAAARVLERPLSDLKLVTLHLGNGASACAVLGGESVDTSMGFTPLEGLVMGTRSGDLDPAIALMLAEQGGAERANGALNRESGLLGLSGLSNDVRDLHRAREAGDVRALEALEVMAYRILKYVGAYAAAMNGLDAIVFTGGVGEHDAWTRARVVEGLRFLGFELDGEANARSDTRITSGPPFALVIPTDEEGEIARQTAQVLGGTEG